MFQLYYNEKATQDVNDELEKKQKEIKLIETKKDKVEDEIKEKKKEQGHELREIAKIEEAIKDLEIKLAKKKPQYIKAKESSMHITKKLDTSKTCYESALKAHETHLTEIKTIETELAKLEKEREEFEKERDRQSLSQGISLELRESQVKSIWLKHFIPISSNKIFVVVVLKDAWISKIKRNSSQTKHQISGRYGRPIARTETRSG